jgi:hypothetical protein
MAMLVSNDRYVEEDRMRFAATLVVALGFALAIPMEASVSEAATPSHKHRIPVRRTVPGFVDPIATAAGFLDPFATALAPATAIVPATPAPKPDWVREGLSRNPDECARYGCIGY